MPRALLAVLLGLLLLGCGSEVVPGTATLIVPTATALPASPPTADLLPTSAPVTVTRVPSDTLALPAMSANQQIFATGTAERAVRLTARAVQPTATQVPPPVATAPPPVPTKTTRGATPVPPTKPAVRATAIPTARPAVNPPTAVACPTNAERAYLQQTQALITAVHTDEQTMLANETSGPMRDPAKVAAYHDAWQDILNRAAQGRTWKAPSRWQSVQPAWDEAMHQLANVADVVSGYTWVFLNKAEDQFIQFQTELVNLIDAECS